MIFKGFQSLFISDKNRRTTALIRIVSQHEINNSTQKNVKSIFHPFFKTRRAVHSFKIESTTSTMKKFLIVFLCLMATSIYSQSKSFTITGTVKSEKEKTLLESATIHLEKLQDSTVVTYTITNEKGFFSVEGKTYQKELRLFISYIGLKTYSKKISISGKPISLGTISLAPNDNVLDEIVIRSKAPISIKKDTLEFNVKSFKTKQNATVEDLLKKLPGIEVSTDGKIKVNGKEVNKILVNGKPFFGNDPTITIRSLTKDLIEKVQISDTKTKDEAFAGEEGSKTNKTINLTIKKENNKGVFGNLSLGAGTNNRYSGSGIINLFNNKKRISFLAGGNNANAPGFTMMGGNVFSMMSFGGGRGLTTSKNAGTNFANSFGKKNNFDGNYYYNTSDTYNNSKVNRENILPDSRYFSESISNSSNSNRRHRGRMGIDLQIDSTLLFTYDPSFSKSEQRSQAMNEQISKNEIGDLINTSNSKTNRSTINTNFGNRISLTKRFGKKGSYLRMNASTNHSKTEADNFSFSEILIYGNAPSSLLRDQFIDGDQKSARYSTNITYRLPLTPKKTFLNFSYNYNNNIQENKRYSYDFDTNNQDYSIFNSELSTDTEYTNMSSTAGVKLSFREKKWSSNLGTSFIYRTLENNDELRPNFNLKRSFEAVNVSSNFRYRFSKKASINIGYNLSNSVPSISQLQPFKNVQNPLNIITGNPNLEPSNRHRIYLNFNSYNFQKKRNFYGYASMNIRNNTVVSKTIIDQNLVRTTTYINVNGNYNLNANGNYSKTFQLDSLRTLRVNIGLSTSANKNINFSNGIKYASNNVSLSPSLNLVFNWKGILEARPNYRVSFTQSTYDIDRFQSNQFVRHSAGIYTRTSFPKKLEWVNNVSFIYNPMIADGFQKSSWNWNTTLSYSILKDKATINLKALDLLNQRTNASRIANQNYIQDSESTILQPYFMLSFNWKFNSMGAKKRANNRSMPFYMF